MTKIPRSIFLAMVCFILTNVSYSQTIKGTYAIKNVTTGMLLRIKDANKANGTPLVAYDPVNWKCMTWDFQQVEGQIYQLKNLFTGKTFVAKNSVAEGVSLDQQPFESGAASQQYEFIPAGKNTYLIKLKDSNLYVTPSDSNGSINSDIILSKKSNSKLQQWNIYEQHPTM